MMTFWWTTGIISPTRSLENTMKTSFPKVLSTAGSLFCLRPNQRKSPLSIRLFSTVLQMRRVQSFLTLPPGRVFSKPLKNMPSGQAASLSWFKTFTLTTSRWEQNLWEKISLTKPVTALPSDPLLKRSGSLTHGRPSRAVCGLRGGMPQSLSARQTPLCL